MAELTSENIKLRPFRGADIQQVAKFCNNKKIWDNLRDIIPFPYAENNAREFIALCGKESPQTTFAIAYKGDFVGCIGLVRQTDIYRLTAEIGYWIGEPFWGLGLATKAVGLLVDYGFNQLGLVRIYADVFDYNKASQSVLEKAGFKLDCIFEKAAIKNDKICNEYRYSLIKK